MLRLKWIAFVSRCKLMLAEAWESVTQSELELRKPQWFVEQSKLDARQKQLVEVSWHGDQFSSIHQSSILELGDTESSKDLTDHTTSELFAENALQQLVLNKIRDAPELKEIWGDAQEEEVIRKIERAIQLTCNDQLTMLDHEIFQWVQKGTEAGAFRTQFMSISDIVIDSARRHCSLETYEAWLTFASDIWVRVETAYRKLSSSI